MRINQMRKYIHRFFAAGMFAFLCQPVHAIEYLITTTNNVTSPGTAYGDQQFVNGSGIQALPTLYVYLKYTSAEATSIVGFQQGSLQLASSVPTTAYINGLANFTINNQNDAGGFPWDSAAVTAGVGGTSSTNQIAAQYSVGGGFNWALSTGPSVSYILLGSMNISVDTNQSGTTSNFTAGVDGTTWNNSTGAPLANPTPASFNIAVTAVPEPSTYISAAMACAALSGVALKKRKAKKAVATA